MVYIYAYILTATNEQVSLSDDECKQLFLELPENMRIAAFKYTVRDHYWSVEFKKWYKENKMK